MNPRRRAVVLGHGTVEAAYITSRLQAADVSVAGCPTIPAAIDQLSSAGPVGAVFVDAGVDVGLVVAALDEARLRARLIAFGPRGQAELAARCVRQGATEFVGVPADDRFIDAVLQIIWPRGSKFQFRDERTARVMSLARRVAPSDVPLLIIGETGTGKEVLAREVHQQSRRHAGPFVSINCAAIPDQLLESELFGYEKGSFTGAATRRIGKFEEANGGTLLLDEIGEMDLRLQAKLLRALQERQIDRIGSNRPVGVDIRIVATTNRNLVDEVRAGRFREDLFYRLNVINIVLPPLRERPGDIGLLANLFLERYADASAHGPFRLTEAGLQKLMAHAWPGNVRELENTIYRAVLLAQTPDIGSEAIILTGEQQEYYIDLLELLEAEERSDGAVAATAVETREDGAREDGASEDGAREVGAREAGARELAVATVPAGAARTGESPPAGGGPIMSGLVGQTIASVEQELILATLDRCLGNRTQAAQILGISIQTLRNKLQRYRDL